MNGSKMSESVLTADRILETAEHVIRRFGPSKATVVDVARALGVSHGSVYRHFPSKAALREAVITKWLARITAPLEAALDEDSPAPERLRHWFDRLLASKRNLAKNDPELFAAYSMLASDAQDVIQAHVEDLVGQIATIIHAGVARGEFGVADPDIAARAVFDATVRFHNPIHAAEWFKADRDAAFEALWSLILYGLNPRGHSSPQ
jgi:AcrR family transcriptional regulator